MSQGRALFNSWVEDEEYGCFWKVHTLRVLDKEDIEAMNFRQLKCLIKKMNEYEECINNYNNIDFDLIDGYKYVKQQLKELELNYYNHILNTKYLESSLVAKDVKHYYVYDVGKKRTYQEVYCKAEKILLKEYDAENKANYLQLKKITDVINLDALFNEQKNKLEVINSLTPSQRAKYYQQKRIEKDPKKEEEKKQQSLIRLNEWRAANPNKLQISQRRAMNKYNEKKQDLTACETDEELALKLTRNAIAKALKKLADAQRYKLKQELKLGLVE